MSIESENVKKTLVEISSLYDELVDRAQLLVDGYWSEWKEQNRKIVTSGLQPSQEGYERAGRIAPRLKKLKNTHRVYLEWWDWKQTPYRKFQNPRSGIQIKPNVRTGFTWSVMSKHANTWEKALFDKYEPLFKKIRKALAMLADQITNLNKIIPTLM
ncbi:conjugative transfer protein MobI(A/C) [Shewanella oncorhynchi]|uniref:conjugative transfer protein MobI(A/C) n=1 Tax=Shewanella TaxID=22 RepID=UPI003D78CEA2